MKDILKPNVLSPNELRSLSMQILSATEVGKNIKIAQVAKQKSVSPEQILQEVRNYKKSAIRAAEKGNIRHFHRTSIESFRIIAEMKRLLSRTELKKERPDINLPKWSSSDDIMMTRDKFNSEGDMIEPGFHDQEVVGASGSGVTLVLKNNIMDRNDYDITRQYPTITDLPLQDYCEVILVDSSDQYHKIEKILSSNELNIPISLKSNWKR
ncbi:hypothetical protein JW758_05520 [Candidatus Peregrinibacteria bacterium]|nr:hypothetical protein [Candidatus Peregrinibacteria bacterium]